MKGHVEAGSITFSAEQVEPNTVVFTIESTAQSSSMVNAVAYNFGGRATQTAIWTNVLQNVINYSGGNGSMQTTIVNLIPSKKMKLILTNAFVFFGIALPSILFIVVVALFVSRRVKEGSDLWRVARDASLLVTLVAVVLLRCGFWVTQGAVWQRKQNVGEYGHYLGIRVLFVGGCGWG
jgi:hypothetical protein